MGGHHLRDPEPTVSRHGLGQTLLAQFHHERASMIVFIVLVP
jgi:hypothetical protein